MSVSVKLPISGFSENLYSKAFLHHKDESGNKLPIVVGLLHTCIPLGVGEAGPNACTEGINSAISLESYKVLCLQKTMKCFDADVHCCSTIRRGSRF